MNDGGKNWLLVFEHPAGAFTHAPERIALPSPANDIALGFLETDSFADIAVGGGNSLTIVRGRGHVYPFDLVEAAEVSRPAPVVETRQMPFQIAGLEIGYFTERRGQSLVMLSSTGEIQTLDVRARKALSRMDLNRFAKLNVSKPERNGVEKFSQFRTYSEPLRRITDANELLDHPELVPGDTQDIDAYRAELAKKKQALLDAMTPEARAAKDIADKNTADEAQAGAKVGFLNAISPATADKLANWQLNSIASDARLAALAASSAVKKLVKVRVSDSGRDELAMIDPATSQVHLLIRENLYRSRDPKANEIVSLDSASMPVAVLPMRLNMDAVTDLVVLREGSPAPTMVMSAPAATFIVTTLADEDDGSCGSPCSLREAIEAANNNNGTDAITFAVGGVSNVDDSLPRVRFPVTIDGPGTGPPTFEIRGNNAPDGANGIEINGANVVVRRLAINGFHRDQPDPEEGSIGGHGITIYNFEGQTFSAFAIIEGCYLGTDSTGGQDRGNEGSGLQIFDSDNNTIGGTAAAAKNVISANGEGTIRDSPINAPGVMIIDGRFTVLRGNYIGTTAAGGAALGNSMGVFATGSNNEYGGDQPGSMNVISGNRHLVTLEPDPNGCYGTGLGEESAINVTTGEFITHNNNIKGNRVGTNATGTAAIGNCRTGIFTSPRHSAIIGSISPTGRNLVSGNDEGGIYCALDVPLTVIPFGNIEVRALLGDDPPEPPEGLCTIRGNDVGVNVSRTSAISNTYNHFFLRPGMNFLNLGGALAIDNSNTFSSIGDPAGTSATSCTGFCNLVSGETTTASGAVTNGDPGINAHGLGSVVIYNNYAGVNGSGTSAIPNGIGIDGGISFFSGQVSQVRVGGVSGSGGSQISLGNLASGNRAEGVRVSGALVFFQANLVRSDVSGLTAIPNGSGLNVTTNGGHVAFVGGAQPGEGNIISANTGIGLFMGGEGASAATRNNKIGVNKNGQPLGNGGDGVVLTGTFDYIGDTDAGNVIANNGGNGVTVRYRFTNQIPRGNRIKFNSIYNNGGLGIDLSADTTSPVTGDGVTENDCQDSDSGPNTLLNYPLLSTPVTATATDADGNTSEFLPAFAPTAASVSVAGRVTASSRPLRNAIVTLAGFGGNSRYARTNSFGFFKFNGIESGQNYVVSVIAKGYTFEAQVVSVNESVSDLELRANTPPTSP